MADKSNTTNATELLNKICSGGTITPQDLGTPTANTQATTYLTEGTTPLHCKRKIASTCSKSSDMR